MHLSKDHTLLGRTDASFCPFLLSSFFSVSRFPKLSKVRIMGLNCSDLLWLEGIQKQEKAHLSTEKGTIPVLPHSREPLVLNRLKFYPEKSIINWSFTTTLTQAAAVARRLGGGACTLTIGPEGPGVRARKDSFYAHHPTGSVRFQLFGLCCGETAHWRSATRRDG